ncbi:DNA metabolism protein [Mucilaginibacter pallidiroseus]|uniref:DNA metabolism protein n=1 Tax=Mucilaginibacter pallidiroseus TaxID=2599295 RepID=A0A563UJK8_9SPHI|nr:TIGR03915 family putative DNA repair protein [Mucilaginibacter pallidiroseus]TWR31476.1 DNA metabolism protein [Mucilaginibacter pallidiroseus]
MVTTLLYDGTFEGLLTAVFEIYEHKLGKVNLLRKEHYTETMFDAVMDVVSDEARATRVLGGLKKKLSGMGVQRLYAAHLSGMDREENNYIGFIRYVFDSSENVEEDYGNRYVMRVSEIVRMVRREKHRMEAFIRFQKLQDGTYYSVIEPDFNVLPLLMKHFRNRYADQKWIIYDIRRKYGMYYNLHDVEYINIDFAETNKASDIDGVLSEDEGLYQHLWKNYFKSVNIQSRKNTKLHVRHIPKRYWKHLTEKI